MAPHVSVKGKNNLLLWQWLPKLHNPCTVYVDVFLQVVSCTVHSVCQLCKSVHISQHHIILLSLLVPHLPDPLAPSRLLCLCLQSSGAATVLRPGAEPSAPPAGLRGPLSHPTAAAWQLHHVSMQGPKTGKFVSSCFKKLQSIIGLCIFFIYIVLIRCCS